MKRILFGILALILFLVPSYYIFDNSQKAKAAGNTYYVDQATGDDGHGGQSEGDAWLTIQHAADTVAAGDTVYIKNGTYREDVDFHTSGTAENRITFSAYTGHSPVINGAYVATGWSVHAGSIYKATWNYSGTSLWEDTTNKLTRQANLVSVDAASEWYLDDAGNTLYVWCSDSADPSTHTIEISVSGIGALGSGNVLSTSTGDLDYNTFIGLKTIHGQNDGINFHGDCDDLIFTNITSEDNGYDGFSFHETSNGTATNLTVNRNGKCNLVNVGSSQIIINGLHQDYGTIGPDNAANIMFVTTASATITNADITTPSGYNGIVFYAVDNNVVDVTDSTFSTYTAATYAIRASEKVVFDRVTVEGGNRTFSIVDTVADPNNKFTLRNSVVKNAGADDFFTGDNASILVENSLVIGQTPGNAFWAYGASSTVEVYNTIIAANPLRTFARTNGTVTEDYNILWNSGGYGAGITPGIHTISDDPDFVNYAGGDYHLQLTSPAIDSGISTYSSTTDRDVKQKYDHPDIANTGAGAFTYYDRGPYEYVLPPDPTFTSASHPSHVIWYSNPSVNMALSSNGSSTTNYRYLVSTNAAPLKADVLAGTFDADGTFTAVIPSDGDYYIHTLAVNLDNEPSTNYYSYLVKIDSHGPVINSFNLTEGQILSGTYTLFGNITDDYSGMDKVEFYIDNELKSTATSTPYQYDWDTTQYHSPHTVKIIAYDQLGNTTENTYNVQVINQLPDTGSIWDRIMDGLKKPMNIIMISLALLIIIASSIFLIKRFRY